MSGLNDEVRDKILARIEIHENGCWNWTGRRGGRGYGQLYHRRRWNQAHRMTYEIWKEPIPEGLVIDHLCRNTSCVNPDHLEAVTQAVNVHRGESGQYLAKRTHCKNGHPWDEANTATSPQENGNPRRVCRTCRREANRRHHGRNIEANRERCLRYYYRTRGRK